MTEKSTVAERPSDLKIAFWNLQNLFDLDSSPIASELGFTAVHGWDRRALKTKVERVAEVIRHLCDGEPPDVLGLCEIENERLVELLLEAIGRDDLRLARSDRSPTTGLDTALLYSADLLELNPQLSLDHTFHFDHPTRDAFEGHFTVRGDDTELIVVVTHWPSRKPSVDQSDGLRWAAARYCARQLERLLKLPRKEFLQLRDSAVSIAQVEDRWNRPVVFMGDLNDEPWDRNIQFGLNATYSQSGIRPPAAAFRDGLPSYRAYAACPVPLFNPMWRLLAEPDLGTSCRPGELRPMKFFDQILVSSGLMRDDGRLIINRSPNGVPLVEICRPEALYSSDGCPQAFELDSGTGISDHFPVRTMLQLQPPVGN